MLDITGTLQWIILIGAALGALWAIGRRLWSAGRALWRTIVRLIALRDLMDSAEALKRIVDELEGDGNGKVSLRDYVTHAIDEKVAPIREEQKSMRYAMTEGFAGIQVTLDEIKNGG